MRARGRELRTWTARLSTMSIPSAQPQGPRVFGEVTPSPTIIPCVHPLSQSRSGLRAKHTHSVIHTSRGLKGRYRLLPSSMTARGRHTPGFWTAPARNGHCRRGRLREPPSSAWPSSIHTPLSSHLRGCEGHMNLNTEELLGGNNRPLDRLGYSLGNP